jgi:hypothetical protein
MTPADFETPITIYDMDRAHTKEWEFVIHDLSELPLEKLIPAYRQAGEQNIPLH